MLKKGCVALKFGKQGTPHGTTFKLSDDERTLSWVGSGLVAKLVPKGEKRQVELRQVKRLLVGRESAVFLRFTGPDPGLAHLSVSLRFGEGDDSVLGGGSSRDSFGSSASSASTVPERDTLDLSFADEEVFGLWVAALRALLPPAALLAPSPPERPEPLYGEGRALGVPPPPPRPQYSADAPPPPPPPRPTAPPPDSKPTSAATAAVPTDPWATDSKPPAVGDTLGGARSPAPAPELTPSQAAEAAAMRAALKSAVGRMEAGKAEQSFNTSPPGDPWATPPPLPAAPTTVDLSDPWADSCSGVGGGGAAPEVAVPNAVDHLFGVAASPAMPDPWGAPSGGSSAAGAAAMGGGLVGFGADEAAAPPTVDPVLMAGHAASVCGGLGASAPPPPPPLLAPTDPWAAATPVQAPPSSGLEGALGSMQLGSGGGGAGNPF